MKVGFSGTRHGMTKRQSESVMLVLLSFREVIEFHHGDCVGADEMFHELARTAWPSAKAIGHVPISPSFRARCRFQVEMNPLRYSARNAEIVKSSDVMIIAPREMTEGAGGTWQTYRMARRAGRPIELVLPDGSVHGPTRTISTPVEVAL